LCEIDRPTTDSGDLEAGNQSSGGTGNGFGVDNSLIIIIIVLGCLTPFFYFLSRQIDRKNQNRDRSVHHRILLVSSVRKSISDLCESDVFD